MPNHRLWLLFQRRGAGGAPPPTGPFNAPSVPQWTFVTGPTSGTVVASILGAPTTLGDGTLPGDGAGTLTGHVITINGTVYTRPAGPFPIVIEVSGLTPGGLYQASARALGFRSRLGALGTAEARAFMPPPAETSYLLNGLTGDVLIDETTGNRLTY